MDLGAFLGLLSKPVGGAGTQIWGGRIKSFDPNSVTRGDQWYGTATSTGISRKMRYDPHVRQSVEYMISPLILADWTFLPESDTPLAREVAEFCKLVFLHRLDFKKVLRRCVRGYVSNGFHFEEPIEDSFELDSEKFPNHSGDGYAVGFADWAERPAWSMYEFYQSKEYPDRLDYVTQEIVGSDTEDSDYIDIPADRLVRFTWDQEGADFTGFPILRSAYGPWFIKTQLITIDAMKHEREGMGLPFMRLAENPTDGDIEKAETVLAQLRAQERGYLLVPHGYEFEWKAGGDGSDLNTAIARCNIDIAQNVAAGFMNLGLTGKVGSYALSGTQQGQHHTQVSAHASFVESAFNHGLDGWSVVRRIVELNYGKGAPIPRLKATNLPTRDWQEVAKTYFNGVQMGALTADAPSEAQIRQALELPPLDIDTARTSPGGEVMEGETRPPLGP